MPITESIPIHGIPCTSLWLQKQLEECEKELNDRQKQQEEEKEELRKQQQLQLNQQQQQKEQESQRKTQVSIRTMKDAIQTLDHLSKEMNLCKLVYEYICILDEDTKDPLASPVEDDEEGIDERNYETNRLVRIYNICRKLGIFLVQHNAPVPPDTTRTTRSTSTSTDSYQHFLQQVTTVYEQCHTYGQTQAIRKLHPLLQKMDFPSNMTTDPWMNMSINQNKNRHSEREGTKNVNPDLILTQIQFYIQYITQLEILDTFVSCKNHQIIKKSDNHTTTNHTKIRSQHVLMDEFCRVIYERVQFHFLNDSKINQTSTRIRQDSSDASLNYMDRLPQVLLQYLQNLLTDPKNGVSLWIQSVLQPMEIDLLSQFISQVNHIPNILSEEDMDDDQHQYYSDTTQYDRNQNSISESTLSPSSSLSSSWKSLLREKYNHSYTYFIRQIVIMAKHVFLVKNYFRDPNILGDILSQQNTTQSNLVSSQIRLGQAIESLLTFDTFVQSLLSQNTLQNNHKKRNVNDTYYNIPTNTIHPSIVMIPRLLDSFIVEDPILFSWWIQCEKSHVMSLIQNPSLLVFVSMTEPLLRSSSNDSQRLNHNWLEKPLLMPVVEVFQSILHSIGQKALLISSLTKQREFIAAILLPVSLELIEILHDVTADVRASLLSRRKGASSFPSDGNFCDHVFQWLDLMTTTHVSTLALLHWSSRFSLNPTCQHDLERVSHAFRQMRDGMIQDFSELFVETILMERTKLASYLIRSSYLLTIPDDSSRLPFKEGEISSDLSDVLHLLSLLVHVCLRSKPFTSSHSDSSSQDHKNNNKEDRTLLEISNIINYCRLAILGNIGRRMEDKFLEIALDTNDTVPSIHLHGAQIFHSDTQCIVSIFQETDPNILTSTPETSDVFARLTDITTLMSMETSKYSSLRAAIFHLFLGDDSQNELLIYEDFQEDETLCEEGFSMLRAQGLFNLPLIDSIRIFNKRLS